MEIKHCGGANEEDNSLPTALATSVQHLSKHNLALPDKSWMDIQGIEQQVELQKMVNGTTLNFFDTYNKRTLCYACLKLCTLTETQLPVSRCVCSAVLCK